MLCFHSIYDQCLIQNLTKYSICSEIANNISIFTHQKLFFCYTSPVGRPFAFKLP